MASLRGFPGASHHRSDESPAARTRPVPPPASGRRQGSRCRIRPA